MSRRTAVRGPSPLDHEFQRLGLVRSGAVQRALHVNFGALNRLIEAGDVKVEVVTWEGNTFRGFDPDQFTGRRVRWVHGRPRLVVAE